MFFFLLLIRGLRAWAHPHSARADANKSLLQRGNGTLTVFKWAILRASRPVPRRADSSAVVEDDEDDEDEASIARAPGITQSPPRGVGTLAENSGWAARLVLAEALGLVLAQAQELARCGGWGGVA